MFRITLVKKMAMRTSLMLSIIGLGFIIISCSSEKDEIKEPNPDLIENNNQAIRTLLSQESVKIKDDLYTLFIYDNNDLEVRTETDSIVFEDTSEGLFSSNFIDFDEDGFLDLKLHLLTNVPNIAKLALFNSTTKSFELVKDFDFFPTALKIKGTSFYYSYNSTGCGDYNWESELFTIRDYKITTLAKIEGRGCENEKFTGIKVYKCNPDFDSLIQTIPRKAGNYEGKSQFIESYWTKNYNQFYQPLGLHHY